MRLRSGWPAASACGRARRACRHAHDRVLRPLRRASQPRGDAVRARRRPRLRVRSRPRRCCRSHRRPVVVLSRHAGEGDSLLVLHALMCRHGRRPRVVLHEALRLDPLIDVLGQRLSYRFIDPRGGDTEVEIAAMARDLDDDGAVLIFPEGGNFSAQRRSGRSSASKPADTTTRPRRLARWSTSPRRVPAERSPRSRRSRRRRRLRRARGDPGRGAQPLAAAARAAHGGAAAVGRAAPARCRRVATSRSTGSLTGGARSTAGSTSSGLISACARRPRPSRRAARARTAARAAPPPGRAAARAR